MKIFYLEDDFYEMPQQQTAQQRSSSSIDFQSNQNQNSAFYTPKPNYQQNYSPVPSSQVPLPPVPAPNYQSQQIYQPQSQTQMPNYQPQQQVPQQYFSPMPQNVENIINNPAASLAFDYSKNLANQGKEYVSQNVIKIL